MEKLHYRRSRELRYILSRTMKISFYHVRQRQSAVKVRNTQVVAWCLTRLASHLRRRKPGLPIAAKQLTLICQRICLQTSWHLETRLVFLSPQLLATGGCLYRSERP